MLDPIKRKELDADISTLEVGALTPQTYERMATLKLLQALDDLEHSGGLSRFLDMADGAEFAHTREYSAAPASIETGGSEFLEAVNGRDLAAVMSVLDDHMDTLRQVNEQAYNNIMRKIREA